MKRKPLTKDEAILELKKADRELSMLREFARRFWVMRNGSGSGENRVDVEAEVYDLHDEWRKWSARGRLRHVGAMFSGKR